MDLQTGSLITQGDQQDLVRIIQDEAESRELIQLLLHIYDKKALALHLRDLGINHVDRDKLGRWQKNADTTRISFNEWEASQIRKTLLPGRPKHWDNPSFTFIDLFAGIGGIRRGFEEVGGKCVFTNEWDERARRTYLANHFVDKRELEYFVNDPADVGDEAPSRKFMNIQEITLSKTESAGSAAAMQSIRTHIPKHDVLLAGFPCQPFSLAGVSKKNSLGRLHGFACETQGTLFFDIESVIAARQPKFVLLENVKNLTSHDKGKTFAVIVRTLDTLGYWIADVTDKGKTIDEATEYLRKNGPGPIVIDAAGFVPQHRERVVLVCVRKDICHEGFSLAQVKRPTASKRPTLRDVLDKDVDDKYRLTTGLWDYLFKYALKHQAKGNGFGFGLVDPESTSAVTRTISARYHKDGSEVLVNDRGLDPAYLARARTDVANSFDPEYRTPRRLSPRECARLMGFESAPRLWRKGDKPFRIPVSDTAAYRQFGNSVAAPVFAAVAQLMLPMVQKACSRQ